MKYLYVALLSILGMNVQAQNNLSISSLDRNPWGAVNASVIQTDGVIENSGSNDIEVMVRRTIVDTVPGSQNYFCWVQCYEPQTEVSPSPLTIPAGQSASDFYADYKPNGNAGVSTMIYCFYDRLVQSDSVCATVRFSASPAGILDVFAGDRSGVSESYPNPARSIANINYALAQGWRKAEIKVYSMLGSLVKQVALKENQGTLKLNVSTLPSGMYFYMLTVDDREISTKKMLVTK
ncbi:MAG: T9SS type A sorting domain-containing protein [Flavobacteriales bacterium]|nr:T9SS type A sorting domain-containing protein [Flavobacteriales bacterium]